MGNGSTAGNKGSGNSHQRRAQRIEKPCPAKSMEIKSMMEGRYSPALSIIFKTAMMGKGTSNAEKTLEKVSPTT